MNSKALAIVAMFLGGFINQVCHATGANNPCEPTGSGGTCQTWDYNLCAWVGCGEGEECCADSNGFMACMEEDECCPECQTACPLGRGEASGAGGAGAKGAGKQSLTYAPDASSGLALFQIPLGTDTRGRLAGKIHLQVNGPGVTNSVKPKGLLVLHSSKSPVVTETSAQGLSRIYVPQADIYIVTNNATSYEIRFFEPGQTSTAFVVWRVRDPDSGTNNYRRMIISEIHSSQTNNEFKFEWVDTDELIITSGLGLREERIAWSSATVNGEPGRVDVHEISTPGGAVVERIEREYQYYRFGAKLVRETLDGLSDDVSVKQYAYYDDQDEHGRYGKLSWKDESGTWTTFDYDAEGRLTEEVTGWNNAVYEPPLNPTNVISIRYDYTTLDVQEIPKLGDKQWRTQERIVSGIPGQKLFRAFYEDYSTGDKVEVEEESINGGAYGAVSNRRKITRKHGPLAGEHVKNRVKLVVHPDGKEDEYEYAQGSFVVNTNGMGAFTELVGGAYLRITETPDALNVVSGISTRSITIIDDMGGEVQVERHIWNGSAFEVLDWTCYQRDAFGRETRIWYANGLFREVTWGCCGKESERFPDGRIEYYENDALKRVTRQTITGVSAGDWPAQVDRVTVNTYDAAGRLLKISTSGGSLSLVSSNAFDLAGRITTGWSPDQLITRWYYGENVESNIAPGGALTVTSRQRDGRVSSVTGSGVVPRFYQYGIYTNGHQWTRVHTGSSSSGVWSLDVTDTSGRTVRRERPGYGGTVLTNAYTYDAHGRLIREQVSGKPDRLYTYNEAGQMYRSGLDIDGNGQLDQASLDRITEQNARYIKEGSVWFKQVVDLLYAEDGGVGVVTTRITRSAASGDGCSCSSMRNEEVIPGGVTTTFDLVRDPPNKVQIKLINRSDSDAEGSEVIVNGLLFKQADTTGTETTYTYDDLGRMTGSIDRRTGTNKTIYATNGRVQWVEDAAGYRTTFGYDAQTGNRTSVTDAITNTIYSAYDAMGRVTNTWGATYPVAYEYDGYGRMTAMKTWRTEGGSPDITRWYYDEATGLLTNKQYADGYGVSYTYTSDGLLASRTWARGIITTYSYDSSGNLTNINYSDATPDVSFTYDRIGRQVGITDGTGARGYAYDVYLRLQQETNWLFSISRIYDSLGRPQKVGVGSEFDVSYGYDIVGRLSSVTSTVYGIYTHKTRHHYKFHNLVTMLVSLSNENNTVTLFGYESHRNNITSMTHSVTGSVIRRFDYNSDAAGRRTQRIDDLATTNQFNYNQRSELSRAIMGTNSFDYAYDAIGNRLVSTNNGVTTTYWANELNQYTNISTAVADPAYDSDGNMIFDGTWNYLWDGENRLVGLTPVTTNVGSVRLSFAYDFMSRRVQKDVETWGGSSWSNTLTVTYTYDGWNMVCEDRSDEVKNNYYVWGLDLSGTLQGAGGVGGLLARVRKGTIPEPIYYLADANGNITDVLDKNGAFSARCTYDGFGQVTAKSGALADANPFQFSSKYNDNEGGLLYYGYRYYTPQLGRWLNRDPIEERGGINLYAFVENKPQRYVDPLGNAKFINNCDEPIPFKPEDDKCGLDLTKKYECPPGETCDVDGIYPPGEQPFKVCSDCSISCDKDRTPKWLLDCSPLSPHGWPCQIAAGGPLPDDWFDDHPDWPKPDDPVTPFPPDYKPIPSPPAPGPLSAGK